MGKGLNTAGKIVTWLLAVLLLVGVAGAVFYFVAKEEGADYYVEFNGEKYSAIQKNIIYKKYEESQKEVKANEINFEDIERNVLLRMVDINWMSQIENMQIMKDEILSRQFGQQDPVMAYKKEGFDMFDSMIDKIKETTCKILLNARIQARPVTPSPEPTKIIFTGKQLTPEERAAQKQKQKLQVQKTVYNDKPKAGRNDPCPCGSGKKYKNCCWDKDHQ